MVGIHQRSDLFVENDCAGKKMQIFLDTSSVPYARGILGGIAVITVTENDFVREQLMALYASYLTDCELESQ